MMLSYLHDHCNSTAINITSPGTWWDFTWTPVSAVNPSFTACINQTYIGADQACVATLCDEVYCCSILVESLLCLVVQVKALHLLVDAAPCLEMPFCKGNASCASVAMTFKLICSRQYAHGWNMLCCHSLCFSDVRHSSTVKHWFAGATLLRFSRWSTTSGENRASLKRDYRRVLGPTCITEALAWQQVQDQCVASGQFGQGESETCYPSEFARSYTNEQCLPMYTLEPFHRPEAVMEIINATHELQALCEPKATEVRRDALSMYQHTLV